MGQSNYSYKDCKGAWVVNPIILGGEYGSKFADHNIPYENHSLYTTWSPEYLKTYEEWVKWIDFLLNKNKQSPLNWDEFFDLLKCYSINDYWLSISAFMDICK